MNIACFAGLLVLDIIIGIWYAKEGHPEITMKSFWLKMVASAIFVGYGAYAYSRFNQGDYAGLVLIALVLGMIGDAFLSMDPFFKGKHKKRNAMICFAVGGAAFLGGHVAFMIAFIKELNARAAFRPWIFAAVLAVIFMAALLLKTALKVKFGKLTVPIGLYAAGLASMGALSICLALFGFGGTPLLQTVLIIAPLLFIASDSSLSLKIADMERFGTLKIRYFTLITYYLAQMLFAFSISLM